MFKNSMHPVHPGAFLGVAQIATGKRIDHKVVVMERAA